MPTRNISFVTGTRAELGLMASTLHAIRRHRRLNLHLIATGMHLDPRHGQGLKDLPSELKPHTLIPWPSRTGQRPSINARNTGSAIASLSSAFARLRTDIVLVVGDRPEALAAAVAAHLSHLPLAHIHGGDRALGQVDDSLRHAITKLTHIHFPATSQSARRIEKLGEDKWRIHTVGSPGNDGIIQSAAPWNQLRAAFPPLRPRRFALLLLHPVTANTANEQRNARTVINSLLATSLDHVVAIYPNNDPGCDGIIRCWESIDDPRFILRRDIPRPLFLGLLKNAAFLAGNSSAGIIESAAFATPVLDIGPRQLGRERPPNIIHCDSPRSITRHLSRLSNPRRPLQFRPSPLYRGTGAGRKIADILARIPIDARLMNKLITY